MAIKTSRKVTWARASEEDLIDLSTPPQSKSQSTNNSRLQQHCKLVERFIEQSQEDKRAPLQSEHPPIGKDDNEGQDPLAYAYFDKLWASSKYHHSVLSSQWSCLLDRVKNQGQEYNLFRLASTHVLGMFQLCKELNTNFIVRFRSLELYNRYLRQFSIRHQDFLDNCTAAERKEFKSRFDSQVYLRMITCILIASKLHSDTQVRALSTQKISDFLRDSGFNFSRTNVARSEMRVLETLDYRCLWVTPLELIEQLLSILKLSLDSLKRAHYFCILLLEYCYSDLDNIRDRFMISIKKSQRFTVSRGKISLPLKCAAIVAAALFIVSAETKTELHKLVAKTANLNEEDVHVLAVLLLDLLNTEH